MRTLLLVTILALIAPVSFAASMNIQHGTGSFDSNSHHFNTASFKLGKMITSNQLKIKNIWFGSFAQTSYSAPSVQIDVYTKSGSWTNIFSKKPAYSSSWLKKIGYVDTLSSIFESSIDYTPLQFSMFRLTGSPALKNTFNLVSSKMEYEFNNVTTIATPIPAAAWLMGSGFLALMGFSRKKKIQVAA